MRGALRALACTSASAALISTAFVAPAAAGSSAQPTASAVRPAVAPNAVRVATYNICKSTCGSGRYAWKNRRMALKRAVADTDPDVIAIQEATTKKWKGRTHLEDVRTLMASNGYAIASTRLTCTKGCTKGAHIFFRPSRMSRSKLPSGMAPAGMVGLSQIAKVSFGGYQDRAVSWAFLTPRGSTRPTLYLSVHLITQKTAKGERIRKAAASRMRAFANGLIRASGLKGSVPIVVSGDFNSYERRQPRGAQWDMGRTGFIDGYAAPTRANARLATVNYAPSIMKYKGFPPKPYAYGAKTSPARIDYVFSTVRPLRYELVAKLQGNGRFNDAFRASDHNMVLVDLPVR